MISIVLPGQSLLRSTTSAELSHTMKLTFSRSSLSAMLPKTSKMILVGIHLCLLSTTSLAFVPSASLMTTASLKQVDSQRHFRPTSLIQNSGDNIQFPRATLTIKRQKSFLRLRGGANNESSSTNTFFSAAAVALPHPLLNKAWNIIQTAATTISKEFQQLSSIQKGMFLALFLLGIQIGRSSRLFWKRYTDAVDIPSTYFGPNAPFLKGRCVSVSDGDTVRFLHVPTPLHMSRVPPQPKRDKNGKKKGVPKVSEIALPIRVCTIDTPETAKFGKSGQPFGQEAKEYLASLVDGKMISIRLLQKDQYGRAVAQVVKPGLLSQQPWLLRLALLPTLPIMKLLQRTICVDELLLREGLAEVYQGMGAVYGPLGKDKYLEIMEKAKAKKVGIWSMKDRESAAEYKRRTK